MPTTRREKPKKSQSGLQDFDDSLPLSQSSDDVGFMASVMQQVQINTEKKRKEKESAFLRVVQKQLDNSVGAKAEECTNHLEEIDAMYQQFVCDYAAIEDRIRRMKEQLEQEFAAVSAYTQQKHAARLQLEKRREKEHIHALTLVRRSCEDCRQHVENLANVDDD